MSHFAVAVIHKPDQDIGTILAPYDENMEVPKYLRYTKSEVIERARKYYSESTKNMTDEEAYEYYASDYDDDMRDAEGNLYSTYNPKSKWDWWVVGGRFSGMLKSKKDGQTYDTLLIKDLDLSVDPEEYQAALAKWDRWFAPENEPDDYPYLYKREYYINRYRDRETYARLTTAFGTFAVVTADGDWNEKGEMGWFGCSSETDDESRDWDEHFRERFLDSADPDLAITIVDCHI